MGVGRSLLERCLFVLMEFSLWFFVLLILATRLWIEQVAMLLEGRLTNLMLRNAVMHVMNLMIHTCDSIGTTNEFWISVGIRHECDDELHHAFSS